MRSERLPGKVLKPILGRPLLSFELERLRRANTVDEMIVATSTGPADDAIEAFCRAENVVCFRGSEDDVLLRYREAAASRGADAVVRVTADCPLIDPEVVDRIVAFYRANAGKYDYVSNVLTRTYPRGLDTEVFSRVALERVHREAEDPREREHVTLFLNSRPDRFRLGNVVGARDESAHRWTVDTPEDFEFVRRVLEKLYPADPGFGTADVLRLMEEDPALAEINRHVRQKTI